MQDAARSPAYPTIATPTAIGSGRSRSSSARSCAIRLRARYWARSLIGWRNVDSASPNAAHHALAQMERSGRIGLLVTQNVDGLHQAAGSRNVINLHGRLDAVVCTSCRQRTSRDSWQQLLATLNPTWVSRAAATAPDGDADLEATDFAGFRCPVATAAAAS
ncbi:MAG: Sir2 family NAD-dependent protein deacetylase [Nocardioidaceae bacterium]